MWQLIKYSSRSLWSDEIELKKNKIDGNNVGKHAQKGEEENQINTLIQDAIVNPSCLQTRVEDDLRQTMNSGEQGSLGPSKAPQQHSSDQRQSNGTLNPRLPARINCVAGIKGRLLLIQLVQAISLK